MSVLVIDTKSSVIDCYTRAASFYSHRTRPEIRDKYLTPLLSLPPRARILDAGCGAGHDALTLGRAGFEVTAVDITPAMCEIAKTLIAGIPNVRIVEGDIDSLAIEIAPYDAVLSALEIFHHRDLSGTLELYSALLVSSGFLVLVTNHPVRNMLLDVSGNYFQEGLVLETWGSGARIPKFHWTLETYLQAIAISGFRLVSIQEHRPGADIKANQDTGVPSKWDYPSLLTFLCQKME